MKKNKNKNNNSNSNNNREKKEKWAEHRATADMYIIGPNNQIQTRNQIEWRTR